MSRSIRPATKADAGQIAEMLSQLGHPTKLESIDSRWSEWSDAGNSAFVATDLDDMIIGIVTLHQMMVLHRLQPVGRITALFVDESARGTGVGRALVDAAEKQLSELGCGIVEITSHFRFEESYPFYKHLGYEITSSRFAKQIRVHDDPG